jgi:hypothetical protein
MISTLSSGLKISTDASLGEIQRGGIFIEWYEAVAIVQTLACTIVQSGNDRTIDVDLNKVRITKAGDVKADLMVAPSASAAIQCLGRILSELLPNNDPMALKLRVVAKATSQPPAYEGLEALAQALAYYERPNRAEQIRAVYDRWVRERPLLTHRTESEIRPEALPVPVPARRRRSRFVGTWVVAIPLLVGIIGIAAWMLEGRLNRAQQDGSEATAASDLINPPGDVVLAETTRLRHSTAANATAPETLSKMRSATDRPDDPRQRESRSISLLDEGNSHLDPGPDPDSVYPSVETLPEAFSIAAVNEVTAPSGSVDAVTYGPDDDDVVKPTAIYPNFLNARERTRGHERVLAFEIVINAAGTVDSAKARDLPHSLGESILVINALSAAKSWRFWPALKQGGPVKYRQVVALVTH